jgi:tetratricopeptide (TPR) repeat protein
VHPIESRALDQAEYLLANGELSASRAIAEQAVAAGDEHPGWHQVLGLSLAGTGEFSLAVDHLQAFARACSEQAHAWINLGNAQLDGGDPAAALQAFERAGTAGAQGVAYLLGLGLALVANARYIEAEGPLAQAYRLDPDAADVGLAWGQCLAELERFEALGDVVRGISPSGLSWPQQGVLAWLLAQAGHDQAAITLYRQLLAQQPQAGELRVQLALLLERMNRVEDASALLEDPSVTAMLVQPMPALATARIARRGGNFDAALAALQPALQGEPGAAMRAQLYFEQAKNHEALDDVPAAMDALSIAHEQAQIALHQRSRQISSDSVLGWLPQRLQHAAPPEWKTQRDGRPQSDPVFLVGFPRSGTTLLGRVLDRHSQLDVLDERPALEKVIERLRMQPGWCDVPLDAALDSMDAQQRLQWRQEYQKEVGGYIKANGRIVDKYPLYLTRVAYIQRLFPASDWLLLLRHPCDCVLSCYMQAFGLNGGALVFSSIESTARTYVAVMNYWEEQRVLAQPRVHELRYEQLVSNLEGSIAEMMAFLALPVEATQLQFHRIPAHAVRINTPSYAAVTRPINADAIGRWKRYRAYFSDEVLTLLAPWCQRYGYRLD